MPEDFKKLATSLSDRFVTATLLATAALVLVHLARFLGPSS
jgi:hypothetical protein